MLHLVAVVRSVPCVNAYLVLGLLLSLLVGRCFEVYDIASGVFGHVP